ncbi:MAG: YraN family protein [Eubacterium sp.]|nr:YraN family protein [Eubacterium sp.]
MISGAKAERIAANYLRKKRYNLVDTNYRTRFGEIDLIFERKELFKKGYVVFVEVKSRNDNAIADPREFVDTEKQKKIIMAATEYLTVTGCELQPRFDVVEIIYKDDEVISVKHLENAFSIS